MNSRLPLLLRINFRYFSIMSIPKAGVMVLALFDTPQAKAHWRERNPPRELQALAQAATRRGLLHQSPRRNFRWCRGFLPGKNLREDARRGRKGFAAVDRGRDA